MEESLSSNNNNLLSQSFDKEKQEIKNKMNLSRSQSLISQNNFKNLPGNSYNLEDIIFKELKKNGIEFKGVNPDSNPNIDIVINDSLFNSNLDSELSEQKKISLSNQLNIDDISIYKSFYNSNNIRFSPNKNYINDSDSEEEKEQNYFERNETDSLKFIDNKINNNSENKDTLIRISNLNDINNDDDSNQKNNSNQVFNSQNDLLLKDMNLQEEKRISIINNFSKLNSILSQRNTISYLEKPNYSLLAYTFSNKSLYDTNKSIINSKNSKESINYSEQARIIQKWWRNVKAIFDEKLNKIIKIQSVWRGRCSRKDMYGIIYLCYSCQNFYDILSKIIVNNVRKLVLNLLNNLNNEDHVKIMRLRELFNKYRILRPFFIKWKCLNELIITKVDINKNILKNKTKLNFKDFNEMNKLEEYYDEKTRKKINKLEKNSLKTSYLDSVYLKLRINRIRYAFDCLNQIISNDNIPLKRNLKSPKSNGSNLTLKKYFLFKWRNIVKSLEINENRQKLLYYIIYKLLKKSTYNILQKYFLRWKIFSDENKIKSDAINKIKKIKEESINKNKRLNELINLSINIKKTNKISFIRALIRKWKYLNFSKKIVRQKMLKMYEIVQKSYGKMVKDLYDFDKINEDKINQINYNNRAEDEKRFFDYIVKSYNGKFAKDFKLKKNDKK